MMYELEIKDFEKYLKGEASLILTRTIEAIDKDMAIDISIEIATKISPNVKNYIEIRETLKYF